MEKFGIFQLLDTLSALTQAKSGESDTPQPPACTDNIRTVTPSPTENSSPPTPPSPPDYATKNEQAFANLIAKQEEISKRIDKRK